MLLKEKEIDINFARKKDGRTALHYSCNNNHLEVVKILVLNKADIYATDKNKLTPLEYSIKKNYLSIIQFFEKFFLPKDKKNESNEEIESSSETGDEIDSKDEEKIDNKEN